MSMLETRATAYGLEVGTPELASVGPIAFSPDGVLFVADNVAAVILAIDLGEVAEAEATPIDVEQLDTRLAAWLGCAASDVTIRDLGVHPVSNEAYLSVTRGTGDAAVPLLVKVGRDGTLSEVALEGLPCASVPIMDAPAADDERLVSTVTMREGDGDVMEVRGIRLIVARRPMRTATVTDLAYVDGTLLVAGASNEEFSSTLRRIPVPFGGAIAASSLEIFHVSHGKYETAAPIRTFVPYDSGNAVLATYTCTPVVHFRVDELADGELAKGRTVAELGSMNTPLDMVSFSRDGEEHLLVANTRHPLLRLSVSELAAHEAITTQSDHDGPPREDLPQTGVQRLANLGDSLVLMLQADDEGHLHLRSYGVDEL